MSLIKSILNKLGLNQERAERHPIRVFLLADDVEKARQLLSASSYDAIFLDHDLLPEHYNSPTTDDERTGYAIAAWLAANPKLQPAATILVHTRNADGAMRMVEELRGAGRTA